MKYLDMMDHLKKDCELVTLSCPGSCGTKGNRKSLKDHTTTCKLASKFNSSITLDGKGKPETFPPSVGGEADGLVYEKRPK